MLNIKILLKFFDLNFIKKNFLLMLLLALVPMGELLFILYLGEHFGRYFVLALAVATGLFGFFLSLGLIKRTIVRIKVKIKNDVYPYQEFIGLAGAFIAGALLIIPGFFTDAAGVLIILPGMRRVAGIVIISKMEIKLKELYEYLKLYEY